MQNVTGQPVVGANLYGRGYELTTLWERLERGEHALLLAPRRVCKTSLMLELRRQPRPNWHVIYIDVEGAADAADLFADILVQLAAHPAHRRGLEQLTLGREDACRSALRVLVTDGYLRRDDDLVSFRSNLLRQWWREHHAVDTP